MNVKTTDSRELADLCLAELRDCVSYLKAVLGFVLQGV